MIVYQLEMIWMCGLNSTKVTKNREFCRREISIIVFGLHMHNHKKQPTLTRFYKSMGTSYHELWWARQQMWKDLTKTNFM